ncbi:hypothetical protein TNCV_1966231 [Trichonephila clavipes]|nr:hypothetical protein TNCV_1966231 [Trichonephila clavipes]
MDPFSIGVLVKGMSQESTSPGLSRMYISGVREGRTALEGQQVADLHVVFLGQRCSPINGEQRLTGYLQMRNTFKKSAAEMTLREKLKLLWGTTVMSNWPILQRFIRAANYFADVNSRNKSWSSSHGSSKPAIYFFGSLSRSEKVIHLKRYSKGFVGFSPPLGHKEYSGLNDGVILSRWSAQEMFPATGGKGNASFFSVGGKTIFSIVITILEITQIIPVPSQTLLGLKFLHFFKVPSVTAG